MLDWMMNWGQDIRFLVYDSDKASSAKLDDHDFIGSLEVRLPPLLPSYFGTSLIQLYVVCSLRYVVQHGRSHFNMPQIQFNLAKNRHLFQVKSKMRFSPLLRYFKRANARPHTHDVCETSAESRR